MDSLPDLPALALALVASPADTFLDPLKAQNAGDGFPVARWRDRGKHGFDFYQTLAEARPKLAALGGGKWAVRGDGVAGWMYSALYAAPGDFTVMAAIDVRGTAGNGVLLDTQTGRTVFYPYAGPDGGRVGWSDNGNYWDDVADGAAGPQVMTWRFDEDGGYVYRDGVLLGDAPRGPFGFGQTSSLFNVYTGGIASMDADLMGLLICGVSLSDADRGAAEAFLSSLLPGT